MKAKELVKILEKDPELEVVIPISYDYSLVKIQKVTKCKGTADGVNYFEEDDEDVPEDIKKDAEDIIVIIPDY